MNETERAALTATTPGWTSLPPFAELNMTRSFVSGDDDVDRLQVAAFRRDADGALVGRARFGPGCQGPPGHAHGGSMAALLDEVMGISCWVAGHRVLAKQITIGFKKPLPLLSIVVFEGRVTRVDGNQIHTVGELRLNDVVIAVGEGIFAELRADKLARMFGGS